jgi:hypothetical protein
MRPSLRRWMAVALLLACSFSLGCSNKSLVEGAVTVEGEAADPAAALAYEHRVSVSVGKEDVGPRMQDLRSACGEQRFGPCELLQFEQQQDEWPSGTLVLRVPPDAVESLVKLAAQSGTVGGRSTVAHDLSRQVADTGRDLQTLEARRAELVAFRERKDLAVADMLALAREIAAVDTSLAEARKQAATHERRIATNLLTLHWTSHAEQSAWSAVVEALEGSGDTAIEGLAEAISYFVWLIPVLLLAFPIALLWRALWRRATGATAG